MTGIKGKSGKITTAAQRTARRLAGQAGGRSSKPRPSLVDDDDHDDAPAVKSRFPIRNWMDLKDAKSVELADVKIATAQVELETKRTEHAQAAGDLLTSAQVDDYLGRVRELILDRLNELTDTAISLMPLEAQVSARPKMLARLAEFRSTLRDEIKKIKKIGAVTK